MKLGKQKLEQIRKELVSKQEALTKDLTQATADFIEDESSYADSVDQASSETGKNITVQMKNRERDELININAALQRIEAGTFGECEKCGEAITEARMKANPATTLCIDCKTEMESESLRFPRR